jgi:hypothetical protein
MPPERHEAVRVTVTFAVAFASRTVDRSGRFSWFVHEAHEVVSSSTHVTFVCCTSTDLMATPLYVSPSRGCMAAGRKS